MARRRKQSGLSDVSNNVNRTFSRDNMLLYAEVLGVAIYSVASSSLLKLKGWGAFALSYGVPAVFGAVLNRPAMFITALAGGALHSGFYFGDKLLTKITFMDVYQTWGIEQTGLNNQLSDGSEIPSGVQMVNMNGRLVAVEPKENLSDWVEDEKDITLNDYITEKSDIGLNDWIGQDDELSFGTDANINRML